MCTITDELQTIGAVTEAGCRRVGTESQTPALQSINGKGPRFRCLFYGAFIIGANLASNWKVSERSGHGITMLRSRHFPEGPEENPLLGAAVVAAEIRTEHVRN
jgi:hypothetical protein